MRYIEKRNIYCTGGMSSLVIKPNGDVYRCAMNCDCGAPPLFNIKTDPFVVNEEPELCGYESCMACCDITDRQKFIITSDGSGKKICSGTYVPYVHLERDKKSNYLAYHSLGRQKRKLAKISWYPSIKCNYNCLYCDSGDSHKIASNAIRSSFPELQGQEWLAAFEKIYDYFDWAEICVVGGEPMLLDYMIPILKRLSGKFHCKLISNLSRAVYELSRSLIPPIKQTYPYPLGNLPVGLSVNGSLHPLSTAFDAERFKGAALLLRQSGYPVSISLVGHPLQLFLAEEWAEWCAGHDLSFYVQTWKGEDRAGNVAHYTPAERLYVAGYESYDALIEDTQHPVAASDLTPASQLNQTDLTLEELELLGPYPRYLAGCLIMKVWDYEVKGLPTHARAKAGSSVEVSALVINSSDETWHPDKGFKIGARLYKGDTLKALCEARAELASPLHPGEEANFNIFVDCSGLGPGVYTAHIDIVKEGEFWLTQKGARGGVPYSVTLVVD